MRSPRAKASGAVVSRGRRRLRASAGPTAATSPATPAICPGVDHSSRRCCSWGGANSTHCQCRAGHGAERVVSGQLRGAVLLRRVPCAHAVGPASVSGCDGADVGCGTLCVGRVRGVWVECVARTAKAPDGVDAFCCATSHKCLLAAAV